jgi:hypothetical protein
MIDYLRGKISDLVHKVNRFYGFHTPKQWVMKITLTNKDNENESFYIDIDIPDKVLQLSVKTEETE